MKINSFRYTQRISYNVHVYISNVRDHDTDLCAMRKFNNNLTFTSRDSLYNLKKIKTFFIVFLVNIV